MALRAIESLRRGATVAGSRRMSTAKLGQVSAQIEQLVERLGGAALSGAIILNVHHDGSSTIDVIDQAVSTADHKPRRTDGEFARDLLAPFSTRDGVQGPDLRQPRASLRIIPGKVVGEPHVEGTRIETRVLWALHQRGYACEDLRELYSDLSPGAVLDALDLERQLEHNITAA